jgi:hypothetical protein
VIYSSEPFFQYPFKNENLFFRFSETNFDWGDDNDDDDDDNKKIGFLVILIGGKNLKEESI